MLTFNREALVGKAIESILCQTFTDFEFIIVNNGSTDKSGEIAQQYARQDNRIKVINREKGNIGSGRNTGLKAAEGDYVAFIDDDDWAEPDFLYFLYYLAVNNNADVAICGSEDKTFDEKHIMTPQQALIELLRRKKYNMAFPTKLFKKALANKLYFPEKDKYDDISQMHRLIANAKKIAYHGLPKYTFYRHECNNSSWTTNHSLLNAEILDEYLTTYKDRTIWLCNKFSENAADWQYFEWSFMISMIEKITRLKILGCGAQLANMKETLTSNKAAFLGSSQIQLFEIKWVEKYL